MLERGYKIVDCVDSKLVSPYSPFWLGLEYRVGEWIYPQIKGSRIFVLPSRARYAYRRGLATFGEFDILDGMLVFECELRDIAETRLPSGTGEPVHNMRKWWESRWSKAILQPYRPAFTTLTATTSSAIRLTKLFYDPRA